MKYKTSKHFVKASEYLNQGKLRKALKIFKELEKNGLNCGLNIGYIYEKLGKRQKAKKRYKKVIRKYQDTGAMTNMGIMYKESYRFKKSKKYFLMASKLGDGDASMELAKLYLCEAKIGKARKYLIATIQSNNVCEDYIDLAKKYLLRINK